MTSRSFKSHCYLTAATTVFAMTLWSGSVYAQVRTFNVPAEEAQRAIPEFAKQAGIDILVPFDKIKSIRLPALQGNYDVREALAILLAGTGLTIASDNGKYITLREEPPPPRFTRTAATNSEVVAQNVPPQKAAASEANTASVEEIVVTGSAIVRDGYEAPTPVTVVSVEQMQSSAVASITDFVQQMPAMGGAGQSTRQNGLGISGAAKGTNTINLRGLGSGRTLVLMDGIRIPPATIDGSADISGIPDSLIQRVDVVTGGASAVYGSDAVSGVVNFVLDHDYTGIKGEAQGGVTTYGDDLTGSVRLTAGFPFADGRGHVLVSGDLFYVDGVFAKTRADTREWERTAWQNITNPAYTATNGQPQFLVTPHVGSANQTLGGIINSGPLKGTYFGPGGKPATLNYGVNNGAFMIGGDWEYTDFHYQASLDSRNQRQGLFLRTSFDVTDEVELFAQWSISQSGVIARCCDDFSRTALVINAGNPYIPAEVAARMTALNLTTITIGTMLNDIGMATSHNDRTFTRYLVGGSGHIDAFGRTWKWSAYGQYGFSKTSLHLKNDLITPKLLEASDAVRSPTTGSIICRSTLTAPNNGCVPFNVFGEDVNSQAAITYVLGAAYLSQPYSQTSTGLTVSGEPFSIWAGPVSLALGVGYRKESTHGFSDALSQRGAYTFGNYLPTTGSASVVEGSAETVVPLAKDETWARAFDLNAAVRAISYSQAGYVTAWKVGLTYNPIDELRLRFTRSRDIRAPNLSELFSAGTFFTNQIRDPLLNNIVYFANGGTIGNKNLRPESSDNIGVGVIYQPAWVSGLSMSVDYYDISISGAIASVASQTALDRCVAGETLFCASVQRDPVTNRVTTVLTQSFNFTKERAKGLDIEASYRAPLGNLVSGWEGNLTLRALGTYFITDKTDDGRGTVIEKAGTNNGAGPVKWKAVLSAAYSLDRFDFTLTERLVSSGVYSNEWVVCTSGCPASTVLNRTENSNHIDGAAYTDLNIAYKLGEAENIQLFLSVQNLTNLDPPPIAQTLGINYPANPNFYDVLGRQFRAGLRFKM